MSKRRIASRRRASKTGLRLARAVRVGPKYDSEWEREWGVILEARKRAGEIQEYYLKPFRLRLANGAFYTPDFAVVEVDDTITIDEVKGLWREAAKVRIKVAAEQYPFFRFHAVTKDKSGRWTTTAY